MKANKILYYLIHDRHPFLVVMKKKEEGWYEGDTGRGGWLIPIYHGKSKPRLYDMTYTITNDYNVARQFFDIQLAKWKIDIMRDFHLNRNAYDYLKNLREYNREVYFRYYKDSEGNILYLKTILFKDRSWKQEMGILGKETARRAWTDNDLGSEEPMVNPSPKLIAISMEEARTRGEKWIDALVKDRIDNFNDFCEVNK